MITGKKQPHKFRRILGTISLFLFSCVLAYGIGEIVVRIFFPQPMLPRYVEATSYGIRKNMPNLSVWHTSNDYRVNIRTNSHGVRSDREIPYEKPPGTFRIIGLGDSFTLGYEVDVHDTYLYQLEKELHKKGYSNVEVINLAVSGFGTAEELITLREEGFRYSPDMVILGYFVNDIENNITSNLYSLNGHTLERVSKSYLPAVGIRSTLYSIPGYRFLAEHSQLLNIFRNNLSYIITKQLRERNSKREAERLGIPVSTKSLEADSALNAYQQQLTARLLDEMTLECSERNIPLVVLNIPDAVRKAGRILSNLPLSYMRHSDKVMLVDAVPIVAPYYGKKEIQWERWHAHWKPWVHHLVAGVLANRIADVIDSGGGMQQSMSIAQHVTRPSQKRSKKTPSPQTTIATTRK